MSRIQSAATWFVTVLMKRDKQFFNAVKNKRQFELERYVQSRYANYEPDEVKAVIALILKNAVTDKDLKENVSLDELKKMLDDTLDLLSKENGK